MSIRRPVYKVDVKATRAATEQDTLFVKPAPNSSVQVRFLPPDNAEGALFFAATTHFNFKDPKDPSKGRAWACLDQHGGPKDGKCAICQVVRFFIKNGTDAQLSLVKGFGKTINANTSFYAQVYLKDRADKGIKLLRVPQTGADAVSDILGFQGDNGLPFLSDPEAGEWIIVGRTGDGPKTKWKAMSTSVRVPLDTLDAEWATHIETTLELLQMNITDRAGQIASLRQCYGDVLPLEEVFVEKELAGVA